MNVGLVGCGRVSEIHMSAYKNIPEANVVAVSNINLDRAKAFAQKYSIKKSYKDYAGFLEMKGLDFVDICTSISTRAKLACEPAKYGHNIFLEKPMARNSKECKEIIHEISKNKIKLCICHNQLFLPPPMQAKAMVNSGNFPLAYFKVLVRESAELIGVPTWIRTDKFKRQKIEILNYNFFMEYPEKHKHIIQGFYRDQKSITKNEKILHEQHSQPQTAARAQG